MWYTAQHLYEHIRMNFSFVDTAPSYRPCEWVKALSPSPPPSPLL
jgi:hypothetical protein